MADEIVTPIVSISEPWGFDFQLGEVANPSKPTHSVYVALDTGHDDFTNACLPEGSLERIRDAINAHLAKKGKR